MQKEEGLMDPVVEFGVVFLCRITMSVIVAK